MRLTVNERPVRAERKYPYYGVFHNARGETIIQLFIAPGTAIMLVPSHDSNVLIGTVSKSVAEEAFAPFNGTITINSD